MSNLTYKSALRGQLVIVQEGNYAPIFTKPSINATTIGSIGNLMSDETAGTATGNLYTEDEFTWIEVVRVYPSSVVGIPSVSTIYLEYDLVSVKPNPAYDASKDTGSSNGSTKSPSSTGSGSKSPGGGTTQVPVPMPTPAPAPVDKTQLYLLFAVLGIGAVALIFILISSISNFQNEQTATVPNQMGPRPAVPTKRTIRP